MCASNTCGLKITAVLGELASLTALVSDTMFQQAITSVFGHDGPKIMGCIAIIGIISAKVLHWLDAQPPDPLPPTPPKETP